MPIIAGNREVWAATPPVLRSVPSYHATVDYQISDWLNDFFCNRNPY